MNSDFVVVLSYNKDNPSEVTVALTFAVASVDKGHATTLLLLLEGVNLGRAGLIEDIDVGEPFLPARDLLDVFLDKGGQVAMCGACWRNKHLDDNDRLSHIKVITAGDGVDLLMSAKASLQLS